MPANVCLKIEQMGVDRSYEGINHDGLFVAMAAVVDASIDPEINKEKPVVDELGLFNMYWSRPEMCRRP
ncbi:hypothetical protein DMA11_01285 [Marinilabiliaceae bacterium JC017]|nr:hypothetical protein DMA11_01285 [Marinilabiliaceae bacterium JC017]